MKLSLKQKSLLLITLFFCCDAHTMDLLDGSYWIDTRNAGTPTYCTINHEYHANRTQDRYDFETRENIYTERPYSFDSPSEIGYSSNSSDYNSSSHHNTSESSCHESSQSPDNDFFADHLKDCALEQRRQDIESNRTLLDKETTKNPIDILGKVRTSDDLAFAVSLPDVRSCLQQLVYSTTYRYKEETSRFFPKEKTLSQFAAEINFVNNMLSGKTIQLLKQIKDVDLTTAEAAYQELEKTWPYERKYSFLNSKLSSDEKKFINQLGGINIIQMAEIDLITRPDRIAKYAVNDQAHKTIQSHKEKCLLLQQQGNGAELSRERERLQKLVDKNRKKEDFATNVSLALTKKMIADPITTILHDIAHAPSLEKARNIVQHLEIKIADQARKNNLTLTSEIKQWLEEQYDFYLLGAAHTCYKSRKDYVDTPENQTIFSDPIRCIVSNIEHKNLPMAHKELIHFEQQVMQGLADFNITDPVEQKEFIKQDFGKDVLELTHKAYTERADHINIVNHFIPLEVQKITAEILENHYSYAAVAHEFNTVAEQVLDNAKLCEIECVSQIEDHLFESLHVIREPKNNAEFIIHTTMIDHLLTDLQSQSTAIVEGKPTIWERSHNLLGIALTEFVSRLDPITQAKDIGSLFVGAGTLAKDRIVEIATHPITTTQNSIATTTSVINFITDIARFTSDTTMGVYYLSTEEGQRRIGGYCENIVAFGKVSDQLCDSLTNEQIAKATGHILGDVVFLNGASAVGTFLKEIDVLGKISNEAKVIVQGLKSAVEEHPAFETAEGIVLKMSDGMKKAGNVVKESAIGRQFAERVNNMKEFFELPFGKILEKYSRKTKYQYQNQSIYEIVKDIPDSDLKSGYLYYLDNLHKDHIEVFNKRRNATAVYNLDGTFNNKKFDAAMKAGRNIKDIL